MAKPKPKALMRENGGLRGMVPTSSFGRLDSEFNSYLQELDPRGETEQGASVRLALAAATDTRFNLFLEYLSRKEFARYSLATIAKNCDITLAQFAEFWQKSQRVRAIAMAQNGIVSFIPDMVSESHSQMESCSRCDGTGGVFKDKDDDDPASGHLRVCPDCKGTGVKKRSGDQESRKMLLEMTGMTGRGGGAGVRITQNFGGSTMESAVDKMSRVTFEVGDEVIDVEAEPPNS